MAARTARLVRGWIGAAVATFAAAASHVVAGGEAPLVPILILSLVLSALVCTLLAGHVLSMWRLMVGVLFSQALFHGLFSLGSGSGSGSGFGAGSSSGSGAAPLAAGHAAHSSHLQVDATALAETTMPVMDHSSPFMWLSHVSAAILTVAVLRQGERVVVGLMQALGLRVAPLLLLVRVLATETDPGPVFGTWPIRVLRSLGIPCSVMRYRGPPLRSALS